MAATLRVPTFIVFTRVASLSLAGLVVAGLGLVATTAAAQEPVLPSLATPEETWFPPSPAPELTLPPVEPVPPVPPVPPMADVEPAPAIVEPAPEPEPAPAPLVLSAPPLVFAAPVHSDMSIAPEQVAPAPAPEPAPAKDNPRKWRHGGFAVDLQIGTTGCLRQYCSTTSGHHAAPGVHLGGFIGGNIGGIVEIGAEAGWNTLRPRDVVGQNAMTLYGLDPALVSQAIAAHEGIPATAIDFSSLDVITATSRAVNIGPSLKIHFIRKGRGLAYVGAGAHYQLWRNRYTTPSGDLRLDFHGITTPFKVGGGAYVHKNIAIVGEFTYSLAFYTLGGVKHPYFSGVAPLSAIESQASAVGSRLSSGLPHFWTLAANLRFRF